MKNITLLILFTLHFTVNSQVSTISYDKDNVETFSSYDEQAVMRVTLNDKSLHIFLDLDNTGTKYKSFYYNYLFLEQPVLMYNEDTLNYNILVNLLEQGDSPIGAIIDISTNSILLLFGDGSSLLYIGEGIKIII